MNSEYFMENLERKSYEEPKRNKEEKQERPRLFAEQFLERPSYAGVGDLGITVTCCTFRGIPTIDDY